MTKVIPISSALSKRTGLTIEQKSRPGSSLRHTKAEVPPHFRFLFYASILNALAARAKAYLEKNPVFDDMNSQQIFWQHLSIPQRIKLFEESVKRVKNFDVLYLN